MKVILTERVRTLGNVGEIINVSQGYGRNYLIPRQLAVLADESNQKQLANQNKALAKKIEAEKNVALEMKSKLDGMEIELVKKVGASGKLFGTVTNTELSKFLGEKGLDVERRYIVIETPIKNLGTFDINVKLFTGVEATFSVKVSMDLAQAAELKKKQELAEQRAAARKAKKDAGEEEIETSETEATVESETESDSE
jgi:large subunit ribosomal protein L9